MFRQIAALAVTVLWIYCIFDVIRTDEVLVRALPKMAWIFLVILIPPVGPVAWLLLGRPEGASFSIGPEQPRTRTITPETGPRPVGPEDHPDFNRLIEERKRLEQWERDLKRREDDLKRDPGDETPD